MTTKESEPKVSELDIRKGDLVKATSRDRPEEYLVFRPKVVGPTYVENDDWMIYRKDHDFEVLERPIDEELLKGATEAYMTDRGFQSDSLFRPHYEHGVKAVIEFVRQYDAKQGASK